MFLITFANRLKDYFSCFQPTGEIVKVLSYSKENGNLILNYGDNKEYSRLVRLCKAVACPYTEDLEKDTDGKEYAKTLRVKEAELAAKLFSFNPENCRKGGRYEIG